MSVDPLGLRCPVCNGPETGVTDSRPGQGRCIRRRRRCFTCQHAFTTREEVSTEGVRPLRLVFPDGREVPVARGALEHAVVLDAAPAIVNAVLDALQRYDPFRASRGSDISNSPSDGACTD